MAENDPRSDDVLTLRRSDSDKTPASEWAPLGYAVFASAVILVALSLGEWLKIPSSTKRDAGAAIACQLHIRAKLPPEPGFFSFEAESRGASDVLATDHFCWSGEGWGTKAGFDHVHARLGSKVRSVDVDVPDLDPNVLGRFDHVLLLGVLYHVKDPYRCLEAAAAMCSDHLVVETVTAMAHEPTPVMRLFRPSELAGDPTNFWAPNVPALEVMLSSMGFSRIEATLSPVSTRPKRTVPSFVQRAIGDDASRRMIIHAWR